MASKCSTCRFIQERKGGTENRCGTGCFDERTPAGTFKSFGWVPKKDVESPSELVQKASKNCPFEPKLKEVEDGSNS